jgi:SAM-dependent methyltransferase
MERLANAAERLDGPLDDAISLAGNLRDLRRFNRLVGGTSLSLRALGHLRAKTSGTLDVLDVGTGAADIPLAILDHGARQGWQIRVTATDSRAEVIAAARRLEPRLDRQRDLALAVGDGLHLPFADGSFDVAHSSLLIHHLEPEAAGALLGELRRVARVGVIVNDLIRSRRSLLGAWLLVHVFTRNPFTRNDAPLSVRRAYTLPELERLALRAGLAVSARYRGPFGHRWALALRPIQAPGSPA